MHTFLIIYALSILFIYLVEAQELAVPYTTFYKAGPKKCYLYRSEVYFSGYQLTLEVIKDHTGIDPTRLLLIKVSSLDSVPDILLERQKYTKVVNSGKLAVILKYLIVELYNKKKTKYMCNGKIFSKLKEAEIYSLKLLKNDIQYQQTEIRVPLYPPMIHDVLGNIQINFEKFWRNLWGNCDYYCYSRNDFGVMKEKFVTELNYYRFQHKSCRLKLSTRLSSVADNYLKIIVKDIRKVNPKRLENVGKANLYTAPLIVNKWYGEYKDYNFNSNIGSRSTRHFSAIVWKNVSKVGIGIIRYRDHIYANLLFDQITNVPNLYRQNVAKPVCLKFNNNRLLTFGNN
uniref:SCP domain-containing protein n=1 Tax=Strongyloides venezuelensis TaxID=75913 RepID=A0A0K0FIY4_STRVS